MKTEDEPDVIQLPDKIAQQINNKMVNALRVNSGFANELHEHGLAFSMSNSMSLAVRGYLLYQMGMGASPKQAIDHMMQTLTGIILPQFIEIPHVMEQAKKAERDDDDTVLAQINDLLADHGMTPILVGGTLEEIVEQLQGLLESEGETVQ
jgi:hypothetical protein